MFVKRLFDIVASMMGLLLLWPVLFVVAIMIKIKMPGGPAIFCQKRVGKDGRLFTCHKFRSMVPEGRVNGPMQQGCGSNGEPSASWSSVSVAGDNRITPLGAKLRRYKIDEMPELWDVLIGNMSFVGPRPDVAGYADQLQGEDRVILNLRPGITGAGTMKYRSEERMISLFVEDFRTGKPVVDEQQREKLNAMDDQQIAEWYNDNVIYPDKVRLNKFYYHHYSFAMDMKMILATVMGRRMWFAGERI